MTSSPQRLSNGEFVPMIAMVISLAALSTDAMLPAIGTIATELGAADPNDAQLVITLMFLGFSLGQLVYGPLSDSIGRKTAIYVGLLVFGVGCALSAFTQSFEWMLVGRVLQGAGAASPRIISLALVRDQYEGRRMAKIMSLVMGVFVLVPAIAPSIGQLVMQLTHWRGIFVFLLVQALLAVTWLGVRQVETLAPEHRRPLSWATIRADAKEVLKTRATMGYTVASGFVFGGFIGFLSSAPQIFSDIFGITSRFPLFFAILACSAGVASVLNSRLVMRLGMQRLSTFALVGKALLGLGFLVIILPAGGTASLAMFMIYLMGSFFCVGLLMGNLNSMAMQPVGHIAGTASAIVGALSTMICLLLGLIVGQSYSGTLIPLVVGFFVYGLLGLAIVRWTGRGGALKAG